VVEITISTATTRTKLAHINYVQPLVVRRIAANATIVRKVLINVIAAVLIITLVTVISTAVKTLGQVVIIADYTIIPTV
jgi:hypothetical protein